MSAIIYVGNLSFNTSTSQLEGLFSQYGQVTSAQVVTDRDTGQSRGFGFVEMSSEAEAQAAIAKLNDQVFEGRKLMVNVAKAPGSGGGARPGGFGGPRKTTRW